MLAVAAIVMPHWSQTRASAEPQAQRDRQANTTAATPPSSASANIPQDNSGHALEPPLAEQALPSQTAPAIPQPHDARAIEPPSVQDSPPQTSSTPAPGAPKPPIQAEPVQTLPIQAPQASGEELEALNNRMIQLGARANAARAGIEQLRRQQAASGFGLRQDILASLSRMEAYMDAAERSVQSENPPTARKNMDQAEKEIDNLETFLGR
jgi:serine/threonine-protein kinase